MPANDPSRATSVASGVISPPTGHPAGFDSLSEPRSIGPSWASASEWKP